MSYPDPFATSLAFVPLAIYLMVQGIRRVLGRAVVMTGGREVFTMGLAVSGFVAIGPAQLFFPQAAGTVFGWKVWLMLGTFYLLCLVLISLTVRPRLSIIGRTNDEAFPAVVRAAQAIDVGTQVDERKMQVYLPEHNVRLRLDALPRIDHVSLVAFEQRLPLGFWQTLAPPLSKEIKATRSASDGRGLGVLGWGAVLILWVLYQVVPATDQLAEGFRQWLLHQ